MRLLRILASACARADTPLFRPTESDSGETLEGGQHAVDRLDSQDSCDHRTRVRRVLVWSELVPRSTFDITFRRRGKPPRRSWHRPFAADRNVGRATTAHARGTYRAARSISGVHGPPLIGRG